MNLGWRSTANIKSQDLFIKSERFNKLVKESVIARTGKSSGLVNAVKAQRALSFWQLRFGGPYLNYDPFLKSNETNPKGLISIVEESFLEGPKSLRRSIAHEMGHYINNINWVDGKVGGRIDPFNNKYSMINVDVSQYGGDGNYGYKHAIQNWGKYHTSLSSIMDKQDLIDYVRPAWNHFGPKKWIYGIPLRNNFFGINIF